MASCPYQNTAVARCITQKRHSSIVEWFMPYYLSVLSENRNLQTKAGQAHHLLYLPTKRKNIKARRNAEMAFSSLAQRDCTVFLPLEIPITSECCAYDHRITMT